jgi:iron uptake system component EfeO
MTTTTRSSRVRTLSTVTFAVLAIAATACGDSDESADTTITVSSTADACVLSATTAAPGTIAFTVTNDGDEITEFYVYDGDGTTVLGEVEDIGPGLTRSLTVDLEAGLVITACKPGMEGDGIRADFAVKAP